MHINSIMGFFSVVFGVDYFGLFFVVIATCCKLYATDVTAIQVR